MSVKMCQDNSANNKIMSRKGSITIERLDAMQQFREKLEAMGVFEDYRLKSDNFLLRYLRASNFNVDKSMKFIHNYLDTYKEHNGATLINEVFPKDFSEKFVTYVGGSDIEGRPIAMIPHGGQWNVKEAIQNGQEEMFIRYVMKVAMTFEKMVLERNSDYGILVCDVANVAYGNYFHKRTLEVLLSLINTVEKISPDIIKKVYFVNAPKVWIAFFKTVQALVTVRAEIHAFDSNEKKWKASLQEFIPEEGICPEFGGVCKSFVTV